MQEIQLNLNNLNELVLQGKMLEAFEKYYHDDVVMQENENAPTIGKDANRFREEVFLSNIIEFRGAEVKASAVNGNTSFVIWNYDYSHKEWGDKRYTQVSVQQWQNGKIIREQFFYGN